MRDSDLERSRTYEEEGGLLRKREADPPPPFFLLHGMHGSWEGDRKREKGKRDGKERRRSVLQSRLGPRLICRISSLDFFFKDSNLGGRPRGFSEDALFSRTCLFAKCSRQEGHKAPPPPPPATPIIGGRKRLGKKRSRSGPVQCMESPQTEQNPNGHSK